MLIHVDSLTNNTMFYEGQFKYNSMLSDFNMIYILIRKPVTCSSSNKSYSQSSFEPVKYGLSDDDICPFFSYFTESTDTVKIESIQFFIV